MPDPITLVCGFGRCGSSLVMQMLAGGGMPVTGEYPTFEESEPGHIRGRDWWPTLAGKAHKVLNPNWESVPGWLDCGYRAIWLDRDPVEQAKSQQKFMQTFTPPEMQHIGQGRAGRRALMASFKEDRPRCMTVLQRVCKGDVTILRFEQLLSDPLGAAETLNGRLGGGLNVEAMAAAVRLRSPKCFSGFLEMELWKASQPQKHVTERSSA